MILPAFSWPEQTGTGSARWLAAMTDSSFSNILGTWDSFDFQWQEKD